MINKLLYTIILFSLPLLLQAQQYGFEWIEYSQSYFKISVGKEGIYKLSYSDLVKAGIPIQNIDPRAIQMYHRGVEQAIHIEGQMDARIDPEDYILFYGVKNDGTLDKKLYQPAEAQPHPFYNIYSDTTSYFLTWKYYATNGKRISTFKETNTSGIPKEAAHFPVIRNIYTDQYAGGRTFSNYAQYSQFDFGEGFTGRAVQENQTIQYSVSGISDPVESEGKPRLNILLVGRSDVTHRAEISVGKTAASLRTLGTIDFEGYKTGLFQQTIEYTDISVAGELVVQVKPLGINGGNDLLSTSYIEINYPQSTDQKGLSSREFRLKANSANKSYIEVSNVLPGTEIYDVTDKNNIIKIGFNESASTAKAIIPNSSVERKLLVVSEFITSPAIKEANFIKYDQASSEYVIISHPELMKSAGGYTDAVKAFATYRSSAEGGGYDTLVADVLQLYNQFSYGEITPLAIFNFIRWLKDVSEPQFLFLIGEGMEASFNVHRKPGSYNFQDLVPPGGMPASDIIYSAGLGELAYQPTIATGRLTASNPQQVINYLEKVKSMERQSYDELWRKRILHLSGGIRESELVAFKNYMDNFAKIAEAPYLGGKVKTIQKDTKSTVEQINISEEVNRGVNLVTFFGHSAPSVTDIDIGFVTNELYGYNNTDKYPVFLINGCEAGRFFINTTLFGEDWMLAANRGALGFIAHTSYGFIYDLRRYTTNFYETAYGDSVYIEKTLGEIHKETIKRFAEDFISLGPTKITQSQQMLLLGDPAIKLFGAKAPDYSVADDAAFTSSFDGSPVTALSDSFAINVIVKNFGKAVKDSFAVHMRREINDRVYESDTLFRSTLFSDTLQIVVPRTSLEDFGNNTFTITIDYTNRIEELDEYNNTIRFNYFLRLSSTRNLLPFAFAMVNDTTDRIVVQSTDMMSKARDFVIELDTTTNFNSPALQSVTLNQRLFTTWDPDYINEDTVTFYLRSKFANAEPNEINDWSTSSFIRVKDGGTGWGQNKAEQLKNNPVDGLAFDPVSGKFNFLETRLDVNINTVGALHPDGHPAVSLIIDDAEYMINNGRPCRNNTINLIAFNKETAIPYAAFDLGFLDWRTCGRQPQVINNFTAAQLYNGGTNDIVFAIDNIGYGDSVVVFSMGDVTYSTWAPEVKNKLEEIGVDIATWSSVTDGEAVIISGKKGVGPGEAKIFKAEGDSLKYQSVATAMTITGISSSGRISSPIIGPADDWKEIALHIKKDATDAFTYSVEGITREGKVDNIITNSTNNVQDISMVDANHYPYIRMHLYLSDQQELTAPQLQEWYASYLPSAEGIIIPTTFDDQFVHQEGDTLNITTGFYNLSPWNFNDSLLVESGIAVAAGKIKSEHFKIPGPQAYDTTSFDLVFPTNGKVGENDLYLAVNALLVPEQYYENNILTAEDFLKVKGDIAAPVVDVRFDGIHIFNKDVVSPDPLITVVLKDENQYLQRKDTTGISLFFKSDCESCEYKRISFSSADVNAYPVENKNEYVIEYRPGPLDNGIYSFRVSATDVSGNLAGDQPYEVEFEVINESTITHFYPYPNPFSSSVRFIFTLTGNELPDQLFVQILTISGRVVKEINLAEFGLLRIGNNVSEYAWNGRDEFGDQLANGVYLYKVIAKKAGREIELRPTAGDEMFKKGYGKLYLLR